MENSLIIIAAASLIIFIAFFIRSLTGFGSALIGIPLLAMIFDLKFAVPLEALLEMGLSALLLQKIFKSINKSVIFPLIVGAIIGWRDLPATDATDALAIAITHLLERS